LTTLKKTRIAEIIRNRPLEDLGISFNSNLSEEDEENSDDEGERNDDLDSNEKNKD